MTPGYFNRFDPAKYYDRHLFRSGMTMQSAELNEIQSAAEYRLRGVADALFRDGDVIRDAQIIVNAETGATTCQSGAVYLDGAVRGVEEAALVIPTSGTVTIGIRMIRRVVTEIEDPGLRDPSPGTRNYQMPGAARLEITTAWGFDGDGTPGENATFYPIYIVDDGVLQVREPPPQIDSVTQALARYDRDSSGGTYVVSGMTVVRGPDTEDGKQVYVISEGRARVNGYNIDMTSSIRRVHDPEIAAEFIISEPHFSSGPGAQRIECDLHPIGKITQLNITTEVTVGIVHAAYTGATDPLPHNSVLSIIAVKQGDTTYVQGTDYKLTAGKLDWSLSGAEPVPGSTYTATYRYIANVSPVDSDDTGFTVSGAVTGTAILVSYDYLVPRIDRIAMNSAGEIIWVRGTPSRWNAKAPPVSQDVLLLATIHQTWDDNSRVVNDSVRVMKMDDLHAISDRLEYIMTLIAQQRLESSINMIEAGMKKSLLIDPFLDESIRDPGVEQTALILDGELQLGIPADALQLVGDITAPRAFAHTDVITLTQSLRTSDMAVNPYQAFGTVLNRATLVPAADNWTTQSVIRTVSVDNVVQFESLGLARQVLSQSSSFTVVGQQSGSDTIRQLVVAYTITGFDPGETVSVVRFAGRDVSPAGGQTNLGGTVTGKFTIPPNEPVGTKQVEFFGTNGSYAEAIYTASYTVLLVQQTITYNVRRYDPLAQTFTPTETMQVSAVDLWFTAKGSTNVEVLICGVSNGVPSREIYGSAVIPPSSMIVNGNPTRARFERPVSLTVDTEYALVIRCNDAVTKLGVAEIGKYDLVSRVVVTSQPYQVGVMLSSSNASTWTAHQDRDLTFRLLRAGYTETSREIALGTAHVENATDLILISPSSCPETAARVSYRLTFPDTGDGATSRVVDSGQRVQLTEAITGNIGVTALLEGTERLSPVIYPGTQLVVGSLLLTGDYVSRAILAGQNSTVRVILDVLIPSGATVTLAVSGIDAGDTWQPMALTKAQHIDNGFIEMTHALDDVDEDMIKVRIVLAGTPSARPRVRNLRVIVS
jgi:hypothetical protein